MRDAYKGYRLVSPHIEYRDKMTLNMGERTLELHYLKNVHSEADSAIWLPKERIVFTAASVTRETLRQSSTLCQYRRIR